MVSTRNKLIYGRNPILDALESDVQFEKIFIQKGIASDQISQILDTALKRGIPFQKVPKEKLTRLTTPRGSGKTANHQGVAAFTALVTYYKLEDVLNQIYDEGENPIFFLLDGISDVRNFGAIARSAECFGINAVVIPFRGGAQINAEAMKTSAGALSNLHVCRETTIEKAVDFLQLNGIQIFSSTLNATKQINEVDFTVPCAIVLGAEDTGVSRSILGKIRRKFHHPDDGTHRFSERKCISWHYGV